MSTCCRVEYLPANPRNNSVNQLQNKEMIMKIKPLKTASNKMDFHSKQRRSTNSGKITIQQEP